MPRDRKGNAENYVECEKCSEAAGEKVVIHRSFFRKKESDWLFPSKDAGKTLCPSGHVIDLEEADA